MEFCLIFFFIGVLLGSSIKIKVMANDVIYIVDGVVYNESIIQLFGFGIEISIGELVDYWVDFEVEWLFFFDGGGSWEEIYIILNIIYVIYNIFVLLFDDFFDFDERLLYYGCNRGKENENKVDFFLSIWEGFELVSGNLIVNDFLGNGNYFMLLYYGIVDFDVFWEFLLNNYDGQCMFW